MKPILVAGAAIEGHAHMITGSAAGRLRVRRHRIDLADVTSASAPDAAAVAQGAIVGGSRYRHPHQSTLMHVRLLVTRRAADVPKRTPCGCFRRFRCLVMRWSANRHGGDTSKGHEHTGWNDVEAFADRFLAAAHPGIGRALSEVVRP